MAESIAKAIVQSTNLDIIESFNSLRSKAAKVQAIEEVIGLWGRLESDLVRHRCLLTLARLLEELGKAIPHDACGIFLALLRRCLDLMLIPEPLCNSPRISLLDLPAYLSSGLRAGAAHHLRTAIILLCPNPDSYLAASKHAPSSFRNAAIRVFAPVRLDLGMGGISDIPPYSLERYGSCINVPIRLGGTFPLMVEAVTLAKPVIRFVSRDSGVERTYYDISEFDDQLVTLRFHQEVLRFFMRRILKLDATKEIYSFLGGGLRLVTYSRLPIGTGLGVSSLLVCVIIRALGALFDIALSPQMLFSASVYLENVMGIGGGWEDGTAIYPGVKLMESFPETPLSPRVRRLDLSSLSVRKLQEQLVLVHTGLAKQSQAFFEAMVERYCLRERQTLEAIERNNILNRKLVEFLVAGNLEGIGQAMRAQWENWKILTEGKCTNPIIDRMFAESVPYVYGARMNGAGQGGCAMFIAREGKKKELMRVIRTVLGDRVIFYRWEPIF